MAYEFGFYEKAIEAIHKSLEYYSYNNEELNRWTYWISLGEIYETLENMEQAVNAFGYLLQDELFDKSEKSDLMLWLHYCQLLIKQGKNDSAVRSLKELQVCAECLESDNEYICETVLYLLSSLEQSSEIDIGHMLEEFWEKFGNE